jgi:CTP synthase
LKKTKFIFVTGGVVSSLGKGVASASIGSILENRGLKVTLQKIDPYINVDPGTMNPFQHGEVFVTDDGAETDLDLGHYERFTSLLATKDNNFTTGKIYNEVIIKERKGDYLGATVQVVPHITDEIKKSILKVAKDADIVICEIGGTVGDIESLPFLEAIRQLKADLGKENTLYIHLTLVPYIKVAEELKTKPTQHSVNKLREIGIQPDILLCRTDRSLGSELKEKIGLFCNVSPDCVITAKDVDCIYEIPLLFHAEGLDDKIIEALNIWTRKPDLDQWKNLIETYKNIKTDVFIGIVGKYTDIKDSYKSLNEALTHGGIANKCKVNHVYIDSEEIEKQNLQDKFKDLHGILVPGGFGVRGIEGKIKAIEYARVNKIPYFGICFGMQLACIEFARNILKINDATSGEFDENAKNKIIDIMLEQKNITEKGATMRLGAYKCVIEKESFAYLAYGEKNISERHRHRFEFNNKYREEFLKANFLFSGLSPDNKLVEIIEIKDHPWFLGCQFHPEFKSKPNKPHPLFRDFIKKALDYKNKKS